MHNSSESWKSCTLQTLRSLFGGLSDRGHWLKDEENNLVTNVDLKMANTKYTHAIVSRVPEAYANDMFKVVFDIFWQLSPIFWHLTVWNSQTMLSTYEKLETNTLELLVPSEV